MIAKSLEPIPGWDDLRHAGLLLDGTRLLSLAKYQPDPMDQRMIDRLRQRTAAFLGRVDESGGTADASQFVSFVLEDVCGLNQASGNWQRGSQVPAEQGRRAVTGETVKPRQLWNGSLGPSLPVFIADAERVGIGRGRRIISRVLGWLRARNEHLALITNGRQWRLIFAGLDYEASCEWDAELWLEEGKIAAQVTALRTLFCSELWTPEEEGSDSPLLQAIRDTRKGQADLSEVLGERVREAVEILVRSHGEALKVLASGEDGVQPSDIYRAACRIAMRAVVILFAESRDLLPRENPVYDEGYGLNGLLRQLEQRNVGGASMGDAFGAWPRVLALFRLVSSGSHHPDLPVTAYGGELFAPGRSDGNDGVSRSLHVFETECFKNGIVSDRDVYNVLNLLMRTKARIRQGTGSMWVTVPVDFSGLSSEYIGIVYEGLLDYELKTAPEGDPVVFLAVGKRPALPLSRLEGMDQREISSLFEKLKKGNSTDDGGDEEEEDESSETESATPDDQPESSPMIEDSRRSYRERAEQWARQAVEAAGIVKKRNKRMTPERQLAHERNVAETAQRLLDQNVLPGEWYLARWGGTRKGSGSFYTRPGLSVPTVQRTLRPLAYNPTAGKSPEDARFASLVDWTPKRPEEILSVRVCDPACGSGSFALAALRFLTEALYASLQHHGRIEPRGNKSLVRMLGMGTTGSDPAERLSEEQIPCTPDSPDFESRLKARLRRHVVERCIYAVDLDPLAVELCRLSLWVETMDRDLPFGFLDHKVKCGNALVGAWFDQFQHYPVMAWKNRDGGDSNHSNGVHFKQKARSEAIKEFRTDRLMPEMKRLLEAPTLFDEDLLKQAANVHRDALEVLDYMHQLPAHDAAERADVYRKDLLSSQAWRQIKESMDLWCACWFWPADQIDHAPLPTSFDSPSESTWALVRGVAARHRFFHWELEFPDVFDKAGAGFDALIGNPPWDIAKPLSVEFFSNIDPLYRSYGKQHALRKQTEYFSDDAVESAWLDYRAEFRERSNFVSHARNPFGDPDQSAASKDKIYFGKGNEQSHARWRVARQRSPAFCDPRHPFRHQGSADLNLYKLFLELAHVLAKDGGRIGFIVPSGLYSDNGTGDLRQLFLTSCRWEWLFGIENRSKIFPIDGRAKFNPVIIQKGGATQAIQTVFMRRDLADWERAEELATPYTLAQVERFSPNSRAILEIQSQRDLEILEKIYDNSVLLGDEGPNGWGLKYACEFHMTGDSKLFPPRPKWEEKGYRPDEYSRWLKGKWRSIGELWAELGVDPEKPIPAELELEDWLFDSGAGPERREAEARYLHGHFLKPGDVQRTGWSVRCAQPPYDNLPVARAALPPGIILSRDGTEWIQEGIGIEDVALPLYEGRMIGQFDFSEKGWVSGKSRSAVWREIPWERKQVEPQYLMGLQDYQSSSKARRVSKVAYMRISSTTNTRTTISSYLGSYPAGDSVFFFVPHPPSLTRAVAVSAVFSTIAFDWAVRQRLVGLNMSEFVMVEMPLPSRDSNTVDALLTLTGDLNFGNGSLAIERLQVSPRSLARPSALTLRLRIERIAMVDAIIAATLGLGEQEMRHVLADCDRPRGHRARSSPKGFWRVDKEKDPELRRPVLALIAFLDLHSRIVTAGDRQKGIESFLHQNEGEGWLIPETLRLADYGLGHDDRAQCHQPVAHRLGPRFYDWQLASTSAQSVRETKLHARNLLGSAEYARFVNHHPMPEEPEQDGSSLVERDLGTTCETNAIAMQAVYPKPGSTSAPKHEGEPTDLQISLFD